LPALLCYRTRCGTLCGSRASCYSSVRFNASFSSVSVIGINPLPIPSVGLCVCVSICPEGCIVNVPAVDACEALRRAVIQANRRAVDKRRRQRSIIGSICRPNIDTGSTTVADRDTEYQVPTTDSRDVGPHFLHRQLDQSTPARSLNVQATHQHCK